MRPVLAKSLQPMLLSVLPVLALEATGHCESN